MKILRTTSAVLLFLLLTNFNILAVEITGETKQEHHNTILIDASKKGDFDLVEVLIKYPEIDVNARDSEGNTALMIWASYGKDIKISQTGEVVSDEDSLRVVKALLKRSDINITAKNDNGKMALTLAHSPEIKEFLLGASVRVLLEDLEKLSLLLN